MQNNLLNTLSNFQIVKLSFLFQALEELYLPIYKGSTFRGSFGHAFKKVCCILKLNSCDNCRLISHCPFAYLFETYIPQSAEIMRKYPKAPHPFIIIPPLTENRVFKKGALFLTDAVLIGRAIKFFPILFMLLKKWVDRE